MSSGVCFLDIETYSACDLLKSGMYRYAEDPTTEITLLAYAFGDDEVKVLDLADGDTLPPKLDMALTDGGVIKVAFNAGFERTLITSVLNINCAPEQWACASVLAREHGLPGGLDQCCQALGLDDDVAKLKSGKKLIRQFCMPQRPTKARPYTRRDSATDPADWAEFKRYCVMDVEAERAIWKRLHG